MTDKIVAVQAGDIIFYVENYKRLIHKSIGEINREKDLYEEKYWQSDFVGTRYYAGLRAFEHASAFVLRQESPGLVLFGEEDDEGESKGEANKQAEIDAACSKIRSEKQLEIEGLRQQLNEARKKEQELQGELVLRGQQLNTMSRRLEQARSSYVVLIGAMALVIVVLLGILLF